MNGEKVDNLKKRRKKRGKNRRRAKVDDENKVDVSSRHSGGASYCGENRISSITDACSPCQEQQAPPEVVPTNPCQQQQQPAQAHAQAQAPQPKRRKKKGTQERKSLTAKHKQRVILKSLRSLEQMETEAPPPPAAAEDSLPNSIENKDKSHESADITSNLGKSWSKKDLALLTKLAENRDILQTTIPHHPSPPSDVDWEVVSKYFKRFSKGGQAVRHQWLEVQRLAKLSRGDAKGGKTYVELVAAALKALPGQRGDIFEIQKSMKMNCYRYLDNYKVGGKVAWKVASAKALKEYHEVAFWQEEERSRGGKIIWKLRAGD
jgi:hypothetical protein